MNIVLSEDLTTLRPSMLIAVQYNILPSSFMFPVYVSTLDDITLSSPQSVLQTSGCGVAEQLYLWQINTTVSYLVAAQRSLYKKMSDLYLKQLLLDFYLLASIQVQLMKLELKRNDDWFSMLQINSGVTVVSHGN